MAWTRSSMERDDPARRLAHDLEPGEGLAALDHRTHGHGLEAEEIDEAAGVGIIGSAQPQLLQDLTPGAVRARRLRFDAGVDDIAGEAIDRRRDPRVVAGVPACPSRGRGGTRQDCHAEAVDRLGALRTATAVRRV